MESLIVVQKETEAPSSKGKKGKAKRGAKAGTRRRGTGNPATDPGPPVNGALKRIDQWPELEEDSLVPCFSPCLGHSLPVCALAYAAALDSKCTGR